MHFISRVHIPLQLGERSTKAAERGVEETVDVLAQFVRCALLRLDVLLNLQFKFCLQPGGEAMQSEAGCACMMPIVIECGSQPAR